MCNQEVFYEHWRNRILNERAPCATNYDNLQKSWVLTVLTYKSFCVVHPTGRLQTDNLVAPRNNLLGLQAIYSKVLQALGDEVLLNQFVVSYEE